MSKNVIYDWQKWIDGYSTVNEITDYNGNLLTEMKARIIKFLQPAIREAESGKYDVFEDIFGVATPDDPKTRILMPYGNQDVATMKLLMAQIREKIMQQINSKPGYDAHWTQFQWTNEQTTVQQKMKPQGWLPGDPIPVIEKEVSNLTLNYDSPSKFNPNKTIKGSVSMGKLIPKYAPEYVEWWQGNKAKDISGKQTYFSNNPQTVSQIAYLVNDASLNSLIQDQASTDNVVILSRHPIDVVRMSDFSNLEYSCHSPQGIYFECAMEEAKRSASSGGGVLFTVSAKDFNNRFPDGKIPQTGDLFNDRERGVTDMLSSTPKSRLRVRYVTSDNESYAVPDRKIYGAQADSFRKEALKYFSQKQIDKFIDPETKEPILHPSIDLRRWGGSYEDEGGNTVGSNFVSLMNQCFKDGGINVDAPDFDDKYGDEYNQLIDDLLTNSIEWGGDPESEQMNPKSDHCEEEARRIQNIIEQFRYRTQFIKIEADQDDIECEDDYGTITGVQYKFSISFARKLFNKKILQSGNVEVIREEIKTIINEIDLDDYSGNSALSWTKLKINLSLTQIDFDNPDTIDITFYYDSDYSMDYDELNKVSRDFLEFQEIYNIEELTNEITSLFVQNGIYSGGVPFHNIRDRITKFQERMEETEFEFLDTQSNINTIVYLLQHVVYHKQSEAGSFPDAYWIKAMSAQKFKDLFSARAKRIKSELNKQMRLFDNGNPYDKEVIANKYILPQIYNVNYVIDQEETQGNGSYSNQKFDTVTMNFTVTLDTTQTEDELNFAMAFIEEVAQDPDSIYDIGEKAFYQAYAQDIKKERPRLKLSEGTKRKISIWIKKQ